MKKTGFFAASFAAASATALSASSSSSTTSSTLLCTSNIQFPHQEGIDEENSLSGSRLAGSKDKKFEPRYDGLRFIETLVTAHR